jgi:Phosphodiester glycosidase
MSVPYGRFTDHSSDRSSQRLPRGHRQPISNQVADERRNPRPSPPAPRREPNNDLEWAQPPRHLVAEHPELARLARPLVGWPNHAARSGRRRAIRVFVVFAAAVTVLAATSLVGALRTTGNADFKAKWADWLRAHHASVIVNPLEHWYYSAQAPAPGGHPTGLNAIPPPVPATGVGTTPAALKPPAPVPLVVSPALPNEGQWQATGPLVRGRPGMYVAQYRADTVYTSQITTAVWIDPHRLRLRLIPGAQEPGGTWRETPFLSGAHAAHAVAAFNGGFRFQDAKGGFYLDGHAAVPLRTGAASIVIRTDGTIDVGTWNQQVSMTPTVQAVLQNLVPLVDGGELAPTASYNDTRIWGATLGANTVVARSGIGVTSTGALVYVAGPALSVRTLAEALQRAGAVRAMALDINPEWVTFNLFGHPNPADPTRVSAAKLYPQMQRPASRYLGPTRESRDFFTISTQ